MDGANLEQLLNKLVTRGDLESVLRAKKLGFFFMRHPKLKEEHHSGKLKVGRVIDEIMWHSEYGQTIVANAILYLLGLNAEGNGFFTQASWLGYVSETLRRKVNGSDLIDVELIIDSITADKRGRVDRALAADIANRIKEGDGRYVIREGQGTYVCRTVGLLYYALTPKTPSPTP